MVHYLGIQAKGIETRKQRGYYQQECTVQTPTQTINAVCVETKKVVVDDDSMDGLGEATMESDVVIVSANIPAATTGNTQVNNYQHLTL